MFTKKFWADATERAIKSAAGAGLSLLTADGVLGILDVDFRQGASVVALFTLASLLGSIASAPAADSGTASLVRLK